MAQYINTDAYIGDTGKQLKDIKTNSDILNKRLSHVCLHLGDGYNRGVFRGTLYVLSELAVRCARLQGQCIVGESSRKSIVDCGCYFNPDNGVANVTSIQILLDYFVAGHIFIYKRDN